MQEASAHAYQDIYLPFRDGCILLLSSWFSIHHNHRVTTSAKEKPYREKPKDVPFAFVALLLFALPLLFTFLKSVEEAESGDRSRQFAAAQIYRMQPNL